MRPLRRGHEAPAAEIGPHEDRTPKNDRNPGGKEDLYPETFLEGPLRGDDVHFCSCDSMERR